MFSSLNALHRSFGTKNNRRNGQNGVTLFNIRTARDCYDDTRAKQRDKGYVPMHDFISDWKRWHRSERVLATILALLLLLAVPVGALVTARPAFSQAAAADQSGAWSSEVPRLQLA